MVLLSLRKHGKAKPSFKLISEIIDLSESDVWYAAVDEWSLCDVFYSETPGRCLCGHYPIIEHCIIRNKHNGNKTTVGNTCVKKFLGLSSGRIFDAISRITSDNGKAVNAETLQHAHRKLWINDWEKSFYENTIKKRRMTSRQRAIRIKINDSILFHFQRGE